MKRIAALTLIFSACAQSLAEEPYKRALDSTLTLIAVTDMKAFDSGKQVENLNFGHAVVVDARRRLALTTAGLVKDQELIVAVPPQYDQDGRVGNDWSALGDVQFLCKAYAFSPIPNLAIIKVPGAKPLKAITLGPDPARIETPYVCIAWAEALHPWSRFPLTLGERDSFPVEGMGGVKLPVQFRPTAGGRNIQFRGSPVVNSRCELIGLGSDYMIGDGSHLIIDLPELKEFLDSPLVKGLQ